MKKIALVVTLLALMVSSSFALAGGTAPLGFGAKYAAMGGAGAALCDDITSAYYNPAGIVGGPKTELKLGAQAATEGMNDLIAALTGVGDPAKYMSDNYSKNIDVNGGINAFVGLQFADIGFSVMPVSTLSLNKPANSVNGTLIAAATYDIALTMGTSYTLPALPIAKLDLGANIKQANMVSANTTVSGSSGTGSVTTQSGLGFDLGAKASIINLPFPLSVGIALKDVASTLRGKTKTQTTTYNPDGSIASETQTEADAPDYTMPTTLVIGLAGEVPIWGLKLALDQDSVSGGTPGASYTVTHYGVEYPILAGLIALRAGKATDSTNSIDQTTLGAGINVGLGINLAIMTDAKNSKNNSTLLDFGFAF